MALVIPDRLTELIEKINKSISTAKDLILEAYDLLKEQGFTPEQSKIYLYDKVTAWSKGYVRRCLPEECKDESKQRFATQGSQISEDGQKRLENLKNVFEKDYVTPEQVNQAQHETIVKQQEEIIRLKKSHTLKKENCILNGTFSLPALYNEVEVLKEKYPHELYDVYVEVVPK